MLSELIKNKKLYHEYIENFISRSACSSVSVESGKESDYTFKGAMAVRNWMRAFNYLFDKKNILEFRDTCYNMDNLVNEMTGGTYCGYRTTQIVVNGSNVSRSIPSMIRNDMYFLFDNYLKIWSYLDDPFLREAYFHIEFLHIHPFEDGNGRVARLLTVYNFWQQGIAPPVLPPNKKSEYCNYIENKDYEGLANMMRQLSNREELVISELIRAYGTKKTRKN